MQRAVIVPADDRSGACSARLPVFIDVDVGRRAMSDPAAVLVVVRHGAVRRAAVDAPLTPGRLRHENPSVRAFPPILEILEPLGPPERAGWWSAQRVLRAVRTDIDAIGEYLPDVGFLEDVAASAAGGPPRIVVCDLRSVVIVNPA